MLNLQAEEGARVETPQQKYQRLLHEIRELAEETNKIQVCPPVLFLCYSLWIS